MGHASGALGATFTTCLHVCTENVSTYDLLGPVHVFGKIKVFLLFFGGVGGGGGGGGGLISIAKAGGLVLFDY